MKLAYPTISLKSSHPAITQENTCIIIPNDGDNNSNLLWQKCKATQLSFSSSYLENTLSQFPLHFYSQHLALELMMWTKYDNVLTEEANELDLARFQCDFWNLK